MKVMLYNTQHCQNYISKKIDFPLFASIIKDSDADIVGLNEIRGDGVGFEYTNQTASLARLAGFEHYFFAYALFNEKRGYYGNSFLSKIPIVSKEKIFVPKHPTKPQCKRYERRCLLKVKLENGLTVLVIHFGLGEDEHEMAVKTVLKNLPDEKYILMGDFNVTPDNPVLDPIRERMTDTAIKFTEEKLSFPSDAPTRKIDYIFVSRDIEVVSADIPAIIGSDHRPYISDVKI